MSGVSETKIGYPEEDYQALDNMMFRWRMYVADGSFQLSVDPESPLGPPSAEEGAKAPERKAAA